MKIVQIMPVEPGTYVTFWLPWVPAKADDLRPAATIVSVPVVCLALTDASGWRNILPVVADRDGHLVPATLVEDAEYRGYERFTWPPVPVVKPA